MSCPDVLIPAFDTCTGQDTCCAADLTCIQGAITTADKFCCPTARPGVGDECTEDCGGCQSGDCVGGFCVSCPDVLIPAFGDCTGQETCCVTGTCVSGVCCPIRPGDGVSCNEDFKDCCADGLDCVLSAIGEDNFCCPTPRPGVDKRCTDECGCASGICCFDLDDYPLKKCVDENFCPCGICLRAKGQDLYGTNTAYCTNDAAASESCDKSCGSCSSGNGIGLEPVPVPLISNPPSFTGDACSNANSCTSFLPDLPPGVNPNSLCPQSQICVACKPEATSGGQGCCLATDSPNGHPNDPDQACPAA